jgi:hypothetical protein
MADDDEVWVRYRLEEEYGHLLERRRMGGTRRKLMMQNMLELYDDIDAYNHRLTLAGKPANLTSNYRSKLTQTPEELYYDLDWADLPPDIQAAYTVLGYNQNSWNYGTEVEADTKDWADLTSEQQDAVLFIGYTEFIWCGLGDKGLGATTSPTYFPSSIPTQNPTGRPRNNASIEPTQRTKLPSFFPSYSFVPTELKLRLRILQTNTR